MIEPIKILKYLWGMIEKADKIWGKNWQFKVIGLMHKLIDSIAKVIRCLIDKKNSCISNASIDKEKKYVPLVIRHEQSVQAKIPNKLSTLFTVYNDFFSPRIRSSLSTDDTCEGNMLIWSIAFNDLMTMALRIEFRARMLLYALVANW